MSEFITRVLIILGSILGIVFLYVFIVAGPVQFFNTIGEVIGEFLLKSLAVIVIVVVVIIFLILLYHLGIWLFTGEF